MTNDVCNKSRFAIHFFYDRKIDRSRSANESGGRAERASERPEEPAVRAR